MKKWLLLLSTLLALRPLKAQIDTHAMDVGIARGDFKANQVIPSSPEAAELGKYGNVPVSLFTGTPSINIPLYDLKGVYLDLPVTISYKASGFKPQEAASWVGLGWSLNAGGMITRSVVGNPDETFNYFNSNTDFQMPPLTDLFANYDFLKNCANSTTETQPDIYYYNFGKTAGKFALRPNQAVWKKEKNNLRITHCITCASSYFNITDDDGVVYNFSDAEITQMTLPDDAEPDGPAYRNYTYPSTWFLTKMTSPDGQEEIDFEYYYSTGSDVFYQNTSQNESYNYTINTSTQIAGPIPPTQSTFTASPPWVQARRKFLQRITLKRHDSTVAYVDFISVANVRLDKDFPEDRMLQSIKVYSYANGTAKLVKQYNFGYGYFQNPNQAYATRLRLDTLQQISVDGVTNSPPPFLFTYNTSGTIPGRFTRGLDDWGFYNGASNSSLIPTVSVNSTLSVGKGANRAPSLSGSSLTLLNRITYPTGGYTTFTYELNNAKRYDGTIRNIGGVRVKEISDYSFNGQMAAKTTYSYTLDDGTTSGVSDDAYPNYVTHTVMHQDFEPTLGQSCPEMDYDKYTVSADAVYGLGSFQGSQIGYSQVTETKKDAVTDMPLGKTVYQYKVGLFNPFDDDISSGDLLAKSIYDNAGKLLYQLTNSYNDTFVETLTGAKVRPQEHQSNKTYYCKQADPGGGYDYVPGFEDNPPTGCLDHRIYPKIYYAQTYGLRCQSKQLTEKTEKWYDQLSNNYLTSVTQYIYGDPNLNLPTTMTTTTSDGNQLVTQKLYVDQFAIPSGVTLDGQSMAIKTLQMKNIPGAIVESYQYRQHSDGSQKVYLTGHVNVYDPLNVRIIQELKLETASPLTSFSPSAINSSGNFVHASNYHVLANFKYDSDGNLISQGKDGDMTTSYIWDYFGAYPAAQIVNSDNTSAAYTSFEVNMSSILGGWGYSGITMNTTYALTGSRSCTLNSGGYLSRIGITETDKPLWVTYWSRNGALTVLQNGSTSIAVTHSGPTYNGWTLYEHLVPANTNYVKLTGANITIDELRLFPKDAQMTTYAYFPQTGLESAVSPTNRISYYLYDGLNRLTDIKDEKGNIVRHVSYNYGLGSAVVSPSTLFYSEEESESFTKNDGCPEGGTPTSVTYVVPNGKYISALSQQDADNKAVTDLSSNGQNYANIHGLCLFYNIRKVGHFFKNDCKNGLGNAYTYVVPAGRYSSTISQADADAQAQADIDANGQNAANEYGTCTNP